jgi:6-pyruvoyltetrahydropterin/6-carboxytetrahydropterin synthase
MKFELRQHFQIESARRLPNLPASHPCSRLHGHSFKITLTLVGERDEKLGWVTDYHQITEGMKPILGQLDHHVLNEVEGLSNPMSENLALWIFERARKTWPHLTRVTICETANTECSYPA